MRSRVACCVVLLLVVGSGAGCQLFKRVTARDAPSVADERPREAEPEAPAPATEEKPAAAPVPPAAETETVPEVDEVSMVEQTQAEPRLLSEEEAEVPLSSLKERLARAEELNELLKERELTPELGTQVDSGRAFLQDAKAALEAGDHTRTAVLIDKCLVLLGDAEQQTR